MLIHAAGGFVCGAYRALAQANVIVTASSTRRGTGLAGADTIADRVRRVADTGVTRLSETVNARERARVVRRAGSYAVVGVVACLAVTGGSDLEHA